MKKLGKLLLVMMMAISLGACKNKTSNEEPLTIVSATGAPAAAF